MVIALHKTELEQMPVAELTSPAPLAADYYTQALKTLLDNNSATDLTLIEKLLKAGADPKISNKDGLTILEIAASHNWRSSSFLKLLQLLNETQKMQPDDYSKGLSCYLSTIPAINLEIITTLFNLGANPLTKSNAGYSLLDIATHNNWGEESYLTVIDLCKQTTKMRSSDFTEAFSQYLSHVKYFKFSITEAFFRAGADPLVPHQNGRTLLEIAIGNNWTSLYLNKLIQLLHDNNIQDPEVYSKGLSAYLSTSPRINFEIIDKLFHLGADPRIKNVKGNSFLDVVALNNWSQPNYIKAIELCKKTGKMEPKDFSAAFKQYLSHAKNLNFNIIEAFLKAGADPFIANTQGNNLLTISILNHWSTPNQLEIINLAKRYENQSTIPVDITLASTPPQIKRITNLFEELKKDGLTAKDLNFYAKGRHAKESMIKYIEKLPLPQKEEVLQKVFHQGSNLNQFFAVQRGWCHTRSNRGSFSTLKEMQVDLSKQNRQGYN